MKEIKGALKFDEDKPMMHLVPLVAVEAVAKVMTFGAKKYAPDGWKSVPNAVDRYNSAMLRHMAALQGGELIDPDSGLPHSDHVACNALFLSYFHHKEINKTDEFTTCELRILMGFHKSGISASELVDTFGRTEQAITKKAIRQGVKLGNKNKQG